MVRSYLWGLDLAAFACLLLALMKGFVFTRGQEGPLANYCIRGASANNCQWVLCMWKRNYYSLSQIVNLCELI